MPTTTWFDAGLRAFANKAIDWVNDTIRQYAVDINDWGKTITGATNATPIVITANSHGFANGDVVLIAGVGGNTAANGRFIVANQTTNTFELTTYQVSGTADGTNVAGNGAYTSGGFAVSMAANEDIADIPSGARISFAALAGKTVTGRGLLNHTSPVQHTSVSGDPFEIVVYVFWTGTEATSTLLFAVASGTGFPLTPDGNNINMSYSGGYIARL